MSTGDRRRMEAIKRLEAQNRRRDEAQMRAGIAGGEASKERARAARVPITLAESPWERRAREGER